MERYSLAVMQSDNGEVIFYDDHRTALAAARLQGWREGRDAAVRHHERTAEWLAAMAKSNASGGELGIAERCWKNAAQHREHAQLIRSLPEPDYSEEGDQ